MELNNGDSLRDEGGCDIGQLFISGTDSSPFSCAQSANNVCFYLKVNIVFLKFPTTLLVLYMVEVFSIAQDYDFYAY